MFTDEQSAPQDVFQTDPSHSNMSSGEAVLLLLVISPMTVPSLLSAHVLSSCWNVKGPSGIHPVVLTAHQ
jgi:hypothetical protein